MARNDHPGEGGPGARRRGPAHRPQPPEPVVKERRVSVEKIEKGPLALTQEKGDVQMLGLIMGEIGCYRKEDGI
jgi:hypothetical protein